MHIFIDESGTFAPVTGKHSISAVGALVVPDANLRKVVQRYQLLRSELPKKGSEIKGRELDELAVDRVIQLLVDDDVLFEITAIDMGLHTEPVLQASKVRQAQAITADLTDKHTPAVHKALWNFQDRLEKMSLQQYVQSVVTYCVIDRVLRHATVYFAQRLPEELAHFHWVIDAKEPKKVTPWEEWWTFVIKPWLESESGGKPLARLEGADYSHLDRFMMSLGEYKARKLGVEVGKEALDIGKIIGESFRFSADPEPGLELVDVVSTATRRAVAGTLQPAGWLNIRRLMIHRKPPQQYIELVALGDTEISTAGLPYARVLLEFSKHGRSMLI
jgi:hypothetical protein